MLEVAREMSCRLRSMRWAAPFCMAGPCLSSMCDAALPMGMAAAPATAPTAPTSISCDGDLQQHARGWKVTGWVRSYKVREKVRGITQVTDSPNSPYFHQL